MVKKGARILWRGGSHLMVALVVLVFVLWLGVVLLSTSERGSLWLLEQLVRAQKAVRYEVVGGTLRDGLELKDFRFTGKTFYIHARRLYIKATWAGLLRRELYIEQLRGDGVELVFTGPPNRKPTQLKHIDMPFRLVLADGELTHAAINKRGTITPIDRLALQGAWEHTRLDVARLEFQHPRFATTLAGQLWFSGNYPLQARGFLQAGLWQAQGFRPLKASVGGDFGALDIHLAAGRGFPVALQATLDTIRPDLHFNGSLRWGKLQSPWLANLGLLSRHGQLVARGSRNGLVASLDTDLMGRTLPRGNYRGYAETDWHVLHLLPLEGRTVLGGRVRVQGDVGWGKAATWKLASVWDGVHPGNQWPVVAPYLPVLTGTLHSTGTATKAGSDLSFDGHWLGDERWTGRLRSKAWPWQFDQGQQLDVQWQNLSRRLAGLGQVRSEAGRLSVDGTPGHYRLTAETRMTSERTPLGYWRLEGTGERKFLDFTTLDYQGLAGHLRAQGRLSWEQGMAWDAQVQADGLETGAWLPAWPGRLNGSVQASGLWQKKQRRLDFLQTHLQGELKGQPLDATGDISLQLDGTNQVSHFGTERLQLLWGHNRLQVDGGLFPDWNLAASGDLADLSVFDPRLQGRASGTVALRGARTQPDITLDVWGEGLRFGQFQADTLRADGTLPALGEGAGFLRVDGEGLATATRVIPSLGILVEGSRADHQLTWQLAADPVSAEGSLHGGLDRDFSWTGDSLAGTVRVEDFVWEQSAPFALAWRQPERRLTVGAHCWQAEQARLCNQDVLSASPQDAHGHLSLGQLEISRLAAVFPEGLAWQGVLEGDVQLDWQRNQQPQVRMALVTERGAIGLAREDDDPLTLPYDRLRLTADSEDDGNVRFRFDMAAPNMGQGYVEARVKPDEKPYTINGAMLLEKVNLAILKPLLPGMSHLAGEINLSGGLSGPLTGPDFYGEFSLAEGEVTAKNGPINLSHANIKASIRGKQATVDGQVNSGEGVATLAGAIDWLGAEPQMKLHLQGKRLALKQKPLFRAQVTPDLDIQVRPYRVDVNGSALVENALLQPQYLSDQAIPLSADVRVVDLNARDRQKVLRAARQWDINADIDLLLGDNVLFLGYGLNSKLTGELRLQEQKQRGMQAVGEIVLDKEARYEAYGQKLQIRHGRLLFAGSISQPALDIEAVKDIDGKIVGVRVDGRANAPTVTLFSDTAMTQDEMLGYLLLGRPLYQEGQLNTGGSNDGALLASAAIGLGIKGGQGVAGDIGKAFGFKDVTLDAEGSGDDTRFTVSGYLSPRLYLRYGVGVFTPVNKVTLRYKLKQNLYLEAVSSLESALDLFYNFRF